MAKHMNMVGGPLWWGPGALGPSKSGADQLFHHIGLQNRWCVYHFENLRLNILCAPIDTYFNVRINTKNLRKLFAVRLPKHNAGCFYHAPFYQCFTNGVGFFSLANMWAILNDSYVTSADNDWQKHWLLAIFTFLKRVIVALIQSQRLIMIARVSCLTMTLLSKVSCSDLQKISPAWWYNLTTHCRIV